MRLLRYAALLALFALAACAAARPEPPGPVTLDAARSGQTVPLSVGQEVTVTLPANPSTGFSWTIANQPAFLEPLGGAIHVPDASRPGAGGMSTWKFKVTAQGEGTLRFVYRRSWEQVPPEKTVRWKLDATR